MATHSTTQLANGHTLTVVQDAAGAFRVQERNNLGVFIAHAYAARDRADALAWVDRAVARGYGLTPTIGGQQATASERIRAARVMEWS